MRIDKTHRKWFVGSLIGLAVATAVYVLYSARSPQGPRGGSALGLTFGIIGFSFMLFAGLLGLRKKVPIWRVGRAQSWMRGHLWLGFLSFPLILFHGGFHFGGPLTRVLMWLFIFVFASGILGAALQHFIPRIHTAQLPMETIYEQIDRVREPTGGGSCATGGRGMLRSGRRGFARQRIAAGHIGQRGKDGRTHRSIRTASR